VDDNNFQTFTANFAVGTDDTLRVAGSGALQCVGFAIDWVSV
jgi:hypothetical protein